jgi:tRNA-uridine 2-sulfurtransferase
MRSKGSVLVAMSGGVDSSVAACLLVEEGYDVVGSHLRLVHLDGVEHGCCGPAARADAEAVARIAGVPFEIADLTDTFERTVIGDFVAERRAGRTPNPCSRCNGEIKFGAFLRRADELGIDHVATGHYVRSSRDADGRWHLLRGRDAGKDQSYMLHMLGQDQIERSLFPVGGLSKVETRRLASGFGLPVASKPDSQELCFAPSGDTGAFLRAVAPDLVCDGDVVDPDGAVIGRHGGAATVTIGQRRGLGVATGERRYVVDVEIERNRVVVGPGELLARGGLQADRASWVAGHPPSDEPFEAQVRIRYSGDDVDALVTPRAGGFDTMFAIPQRGVAPGQSAVVYRGDELLGGGRIVRATP